MQKKSSATSLSDRSMSDYDTGRGSPSKLPEIVEDPVKENPADFLEKDDPNDGLYIIESGTCHLVHRNDQFNAREMRRWDFFGECELLKCIGYTYFGDVIAVSEKEVRTLFISKANFKKIPVYEQLVMKQYCQAR